MGSRGGQAAPFPLPYSPPLLLLHPQRFGPPKSTPILRARWARNGGNPREAEAQSSWGRLRASRGSCRCQHGAGNTRGQTKCQDLAAPLGRVLDLCPPPAFSPSSAVSSLTFWGISQLLAVHPLASGSLYLDKKGNFVGGCKGQRGPMVLQGTKGAWGRQSLGTWRVWRS